MSCLHRPSIPVETRLRVVLHQLGEMWPDRIIKDAKRVSLGLGHVLEEKLCALAELLGCARKDLHLDHDPPLGARGRTGEGKDTVYDPPANDPRFLIYRTKAGHQEKTNLRGEHGQHPDRVLIKRERRRRRALSRTKKALKSARKWPKRALRSRNDLRRTKVRRPQLPLPPRR